MYPILSVPLYVEKLICLRISKSQVYAYLVRFLALGWHLEEIHVTWAHLEKKQMRLQTYTKSLKNDENAIRTLGDYSKPSHKGYRNTIELLVGNNVVPLRSVTIWLVQNGCSFHGLWSKDLNQHLKDFLKLVDSLNLDGTNRERTRLCLLQFSLRDQARNWRERIPAGSITTWEDLTTHFLAQFFPQKGLANPRSHDIPNVDNNIMEISAFLKHGLILRTYSENSLTMELIFGRLRKMSAEKAWATIEELARYEDEGWNDLVASREGSLDYENPDIENLLGVMKCKVDTLMKEAISLMERKKRKPRESNPNQQMQRKNAEINQSKNIQKLLFEAEIANLGKD
ncbi:zinc finger, CCHC-type containing protein [Tanacetum coccineum]